MMSQRVSISVITIIFLYSCTYEKIVPIDDCATTNSSFIRSILPILQNTCAAGSSCHGEGSFNGPGALTDYSTAKAASVAIRDAVQSGRMPQGSVLTAQERQAIICWVNSGAPNN